MDTVVFLVATGLTAKFIYTFLYLFYNRHSMHDRPGRHRVPDGVRRKYREQVSVEDIITTGDIYGARRTTSKMGIF
jgi:hypothetical protein